MSGPVHVLGMTSRQCLPHFSEMGRGFGKAFFPLLIVREIFILWLCLVEVCWEKWRVVNKVDRARMGSHGTESNTWMDGWTVAHTDESDQIGSDQIGVEQSMFVAYAGVDNFVPDQMYRQTSLLFAQYTLFWICISFGDATFLKLHFFWRRIYQCFWIRPYENGCKKMRMSSGKMGRLKLRFFWKIVYLKEKGESKQCKIN